MTSALLQSLFDLETAIELRQVHKHFIKLLKTLILARRAMKFLESKFLCISKVLVFLDNFFWTRLNLKDLNLLDKEKISMQKLYNTAINSYY